MEEFFELERKVTFYDSMNEKRRGKMKRREMKRRKTKRGIRKQAGLMALTSFTWDKATCRVNSNQNRGVISQHCERERKRKREKEQEKGYV